MQLSAIVLSDPESVEVDTKAKSFTYFCKRSPAKVDTGLVVELKEMVRKLSGKNVRLCLHDSPQAMFHDMIILEHKGKYYRPHRHLTKGESYHIIEGSMAAFVFDQSGCVIDACLLEAQGSFIYRVGVNEYHCTVPLTDPVIYHESKPGPFMGESDSVYPDWAPDGSDGGAVANFTNELLLMVEVR